MKKLTALAAAISACLLAGSLTAQEPDTSTSTRTGDTSRTGSASSSETQSAGQGATTDDMSRQRTADVSGMQHARLDTKEFAQKAAESGLAEVEMGKLAAQKATDPEVKAFGQRMVTDHTKANKELMAAAKMKNLELPTEPGMMHKGEMKKMEMQKGDADFDHDYMQAMVREHEKDVEFFRNASTSTNVDPELRAVAKKTLPTLQDHLKEAQRLEAKLAKKD